MDDIIRRPAVGPRVAVAQFSPVLGRVDSNLEKHRELIAKAREEGVDVLVFPELSLTGYRLKDTVPEVALTRSSEAFRELAALSSEISLVVGLVEETREHRFYNASVFFEAGRILSVHRKVYLPTYGMFDEQRYFARGQRIQAFNSKYGRMAMLVCEDMLHPSAAMIAGLDGASVIIVPSASPVDGVLAAAGEEAPGSAVGPEKDGSEVAGDVGANGRHWESWNRNMARALGLYVVYANRCGNEDGHVYWGGSELIGPSGDLLAKGAYYGEDSISAVLSEDAVRRRRIKSPLLRDEDLDLTVNEYTRLRERPASGQQRAAPRDRHPGDRAAREQNRGYGGRDRGGRDQDRGYGRRDRGGRDRDDRQRSWQVRERGGRDQDRGWQGGERGGRDREDRERNWQGRDRGGRDQDRGYGGRDRGGRDRDDRQRSWQGRDRLESEPERRRPRAKPLRGERKPRSPNTALLFGEDDES